MDQKLSQPRSDLPSSACTCGHLAGSHNFPFPPYRTHQVGSPCEEPGCGCQEYEAIGDEDPYSAESIGRRIEAGDDLGTRFEESEQ